VTLHSINDEHAATFLLADTSVTTPLKLQGIYNIFNAAAALALVRTIVADKYDETRLIQALANVTPAFGRGESLTINGRPLELVLVKNPAGFRLSLASFKPDRYATMIAINDNYSDGRDMSWLWDVDFASFKTTGIAEVSGVRAYDMALRLQYDEIELSHVGTDLKQSLRRLIDRHPNQPKRIYCTYTAMLGLRRELSKMTDVEAVR
jgi:UDP-N-acetylmuramyl tripeptide synthase